MKRPFKWRLHERQKREDRYNEFTLAAFPFHSISTYQSFGCASLSLSSGCFFPKTLLLSHFIQWKWRKREGWLPKKMAASGAPAFDLENRPFFLRIYWFPARKTRKNRFELPESRSNGVGIYWINWSLEFSFIPKMTSSSAALPRFFFSLLCVLIFSRATTQQWHLSDEPIFCLVTPDDYQNYTKAKVAKTAATLSSSSYIVIIISDSIAASTSKGFLVASLRSPTQ